VRASRRGYVWAIFVVCRAATGQGTAYLSTPKKKKRGRNAAFVPHLRQFAHTGPYLGEGERHGPVHSRPSTKKTGRLLLGERG
jgi:hypothetical protein